MLFLTLFILEIIFLFFISRVLTKSLSRVFLRITKSQTVTIHLLSFLFLPGVIVHELSHLLVAGVLFVRTGEIEFMPKIIDGGVKLGSVTIAKTDPVRRAIIGFAPVFVGLSAILGIIYFAVDNSSIVRTIELDNTLKIIIFISIFYLLFAISNTMFSSRKDMEGTIELLAVIAIIFTAFYVMGFRTSFSIPNIFIDKIVDLIKTLDLFLLWPLAIDFVIVGIIKVFNR